MKKLLLLGSLGLSLTLFGCVQYEDGEPVENTEEDTSTAAKPAEESENNEPSATEDTADGEKEKEASSNGSLPENISDLDVSDVRNDDTGKLKKVVTSKELNMPDNAAAYYDEYMSEGEIHYIINFSDNTTTAINNMSGQLFVTITEYVDKEEHDANIIGSGMVLSDYIVSLSDGTIEEVEKESDTSFEDEIFEIVNETIGKDKVTNLVALSDGAESTMSVTFESEDFNYGPAGKDKIDMEIAETLIKLKELEAPPFYDITFLATLDDNIIYRASYNQDALNNDVTDDPHKFRLRLEEISVGYYIDPILED